MIPNDPSVAPPFVDPRESLENPNIEEPVEDDIPVFPSPPPIDPFPLAEPSAPSAVAAAPPSLRTQLKRWKSILGEMKMTILWKN